MPDSTDIEKRLQAHVLAEFLPGDPPESVTPTTPLISTGILDSIATLRFVSFLEQEYGIQIEAHEAGADNFESIERIAALVRSKLQG